MLKLVTAVEFQSGLCVPLRRQGVCCPTDCSLEIRETVGLYLHIAHSGLVGLSLVEMEAPDIPFHPSTAVHQAAKGVRSFIGSLGETETTKNSVEKVIDFHWL